ncbi:MAG: Ku protein [Myxococcota bacterium]
MLRPYWSGEIRLSLVSLPVNVYPALNRSKQIAFHEIHKPTGQRVHHQNVVDGEPVDKEDIVKGYEVSKGEYVLIEPSEIKELKIPSGQTLEITQFVEMDAIDAMYFETPYFVAPDGKRGHDAFAVIREALKACEKIGIGQLAIAGRERLCAIKPYENGLILETLRYEDEIKDIAPYFADIKASKIDKEQLDLAKELIKRKTSPFKPEKFHDHYREALQELIDSKVEHRPLKKVADEKPMGKVINLMDALRKSLKEKAAAPKKKAAHG